MFLAQHSGQLGVFLFQVLLEQVDQVDVLHAEHSRVTGSGSRESLSCWEGVLKNVQQEMLNLECAKNKHAKNSMSKNSSLANEVIGHIGWEVKLLKITFMGPFLFIAVPSSSIGSKISLGLYSSSKY